MTSKKGQSKRPAAKPDAKSEWSAMTKNVSADVFTINAVFVPAALQLGPGMADSGDTAVERHDLFARVLFELGYIQSVDYLEAPPDVAASAWLNDRMFLTKMQLQTFDQVCCDNPLLYMFLRILMFRGLAQTVRRIIRESVNKIFSSPITHKSPPEIKDALLLITGKTLNTADTKDQVTIIHEDHPMRSVLTEPKNFVLCPENAKVKSSLAGLHLDSHKEFVLNILKNYGRITPAFGDDGRQLNHVELDAYIKPASDSPMFNVLTGYFFFNGIAKGPRMEECLLAGIVIRPDGTHDMSKIFDQKLITSDGMTDDFIVNHRLMALLDFYVFTSIYASLPSAAEFRPFFELRYRQYLIHDGQEGNRDMRAELKDVLEKYLDKYPHTAQQVRKTKKSRGGAGFGVGTVVDLTDDEVRLWATLPAGGAKGVGGPAGEADAGGGPGQGAASGGATNAGGPQ